MVDEAEKLLKEAGIEYFCSPLARKERYYALLHESVLDDNGRPTQEFLRSCYGGAFGCIMDGELEKGRQILARNLKKMMKRQEIQRMEDLSDFAYDAETEFLYGARQIGKVMLELLAALETNDDLIDHNVFRARDLLSKSGE